MAVAGVSYIFLLYLFVRFLISGKRFLGAAQQDEERMIRDGKLSLKELQESWKYNFDKVVAYSSFGLGTMILAAVFIFEQRLSGYDASMFTLVLAVFGTSVMNYFISLQFWFLALDAGGSVYTRVRYRHLATAFQSIGLLAIVLAVLLALIAVNTLLGYIFSAVALLSLVTVLEFKYAISLQAEYREATLNEFQQSIQPASLYPKNESAPGAAWDGRESIRILNWNIERGFKKDRLLAYIKECDADIICLQEVDWGNLRTGGEDVLEYLAGEMGMPGWFGVEFYEIQTPYRWKKLAGGGVHGNAILARIQPSRVFRLELPTTFNWNAPAPEQTAITKIEKRKGARFALCAEFELTGKKLVVSSVHLEDKYIGVAGRFAQFQAILQQLDAEMAPGDLSVIAGDLNTLDNGLARLTGWSKADRSLGKPWHVSECKWWKEKLLAQSGYVDPWTCRDWTHNVLQVYREKLDWILVRNSPILRYGRGKIDISDHRPLWVDIQVAAPD